MRMIKIIGIFTVLALTGCGQYVADTKALSEKMAKCESVGMATILEFPDNNDGSVKVKCVEKWK